MVDFLFVVIELFCYLLRLLHYKRKSIEVSVFQGGGLIERKFQTKGAPPTNYCCCQKNIVIVLSCGPKYPQCIVWFCHKARVIQTDRQTETDRITTAKTSLA